MLSLIIFLRIKSDHNPILFSSKPPSFSFRPRPFHCDRIWINQPDFIKVAETVWHQNHDCSLTKILGLFKTQAILRNKYSFGNLFQRKKRIFAQLQGINIALSNGPNVFLESLQNDLSLELQHVLALEEEFWASKSRVDWLNLGDFNTFFFQWVIGLIMSMILKGLFVITLKIFSLVPQSLFFLYPSIIFPINMSCFFPLLLFLLMK